MRVLLDIDIDGYESEEGEMAGIIEALEYLDSAAVSVNIIKIWKPDE